MRIIESNPYRYLGVYSNSPTKERVANLAKINAFLKVDKQVEFPLDLSNLLGTMERTNKTITDAVAKLTLPVDLIKYAQFWWMKVTPGDEEVFSHLLKGEVTEAKKIWEKLEDISSLQNRIVLSLIEGDFSTAICFAEKLYDTYALSFISFIINDGSPITNVTLSHNFIDVLMNEGVNILNFQNYVTNNNWKKYVSDKTTEPLINSINQVIAVAKSSRGQNYNDRYEAGQTLMESTKGTLDKLKSIIPMTDLRYETIADKLGLEILQCGIDYYNSSNDNDRAQRTQKMIQGALSIVVGNLAKQRCQDQANNIEKIRE